MPAGGHILITGSEGLVGSALAAALKSRSEPFACLDLRATAPHEHGDVRRSADVARAIANCRGIVHLAAVSRVVWGELDPELCWSTNVEGTRSIVEAALAAPQPPWILFASSREVYGQATQLPVTEEAPLSPVNVYGRAKVAAELAVLCARERGIKTCVVRLSNVYGSTRDHADRVLPAFARRALAGEPLRVDGFEHTFDFTHVDDVVVGLLAAIELLESGESPPPLHLVTGTATTLRAAAELAVELAASRSIIVSGPPRSYDVARFQGDPSRAQALLGWRAGIQLRHGLEGLIAAFRREVIS